jgi:hypothetical protein
MTERAVVVTSETGGLVAGKVEGWRWGCRWLARNEEVWQLTYPSKRGSPTIHSRCLASFQTALLDPLGQEIDARR